MTNPSAIPPHQDPIWRPDNNEISYLEYVTTLVATLDRRFDTLHQDLKDSITDRFAAVSQQFKDIDLRYQQRFDAQTKALDAALAAAKEAGQAALTAAKEATTKAEVASEKRFESVNEFRKTLSDQTATFLPRSEADARMNGLSEKIDDFKTATVAAQSNIETRLATYAGRSGGAASLWGYILGALGAVSIIVTLAVTLKNR